MEINSKKVWGKKEMITKKYTTALFTFNVQLLWYNVCVNLILYFPFYVLASLKVYWEYNLTATCVSIMATTELGHQYNPSPLISANWELTYPVIKCFEGEVLLCCVTPKTLKQPISGEQQAVRMISIWQWGSNVCAIYCCEHNEKILLLSAWVKYWWAAPELYTHFENVSTNQLRITQKQLISR